MSEKITIELNNNECALIATNSGSIDMVLPIKGDMLWNAVLLTTIARCIKDDDEEFMKLVVRKTGIFKNG